jgi:hypothetical protein
MVTYADNPDYLRAEALRTLSGPEYRQEVVMNNLPDYIIKGSFRLIVLDFLILTLGHSSKNSSPVGKPWEIC